jgi:hypothetical protein
MSTVKILVKTSWLSTTKIYQRKERRKKGRKEGRKEGKKKGGREGEREYQKILLCSCPYPIIIHHSQNSEVHITYSSIHSFNKYSRSCEGYSKVSGFLLSILCAGDTDMKEMWFLISISSRLGRPGGHEIVTALYLLVGFEPAKG